MEGGIFSQQVSLNSPSESERSSTPVPFDERFGSLQSQLAMLRDEREKAVSHLGLLNRIHENGMVSVEDLNINLRPAINNQKKANTSLERAIKRIMNSRSHIAALQEFVSENLTSRTLLLPPPPPPPPTTTTTTTPTPTTTEERQQVVDNVADGQTTAEIFLQ
jgi:hypothetical protein